MCAVIIGGLYCAGLLPLLAAQSCQCVILRAGLPLVAAFITNTVSIGTDSAAAAVSMTVALLLLWWWSAVHVIVATSR